MELQDIFTPNDRKGAPRRVYIRRNIELKNYGYTEGCVGCEAVSAETKPIGHTEACRLRIEAAMLQDAAERIEVARTRCAKGRPVAGGERSPTAPRVYIRRTDLARVGYTECCPGCKASREKPPRSINHNEACRKRNERKLLEDPNTATRVERAQRRSKERAGGAEKEEKQ